MKKHYVLHHILFWCILLGCILFVRNDSPFANESILDGESALIEKEEEYNTAKEEYDNAVAEQKEKVTEAQNIADNVYLNFMNSHIKEFQAKGIDSAMTSDEWLAYLKTTDYVKNGHPLSDKFYLKFNQAFTEKYFNRIVTFANLQNKYRKDSTNIANGNLEIQKLSFAKIMFSIVSNAFNVCYTPHSFCESEFEENKAQVDCENWGACSDAESAFIAWYESEKEEYESGNTNYNSIGHYFNICCEYFPSVGFGISGSATMNAGHVDGTEMSVSDFSSALNSYVSKAKSNLATITQEEATKVNQAKSKLDTVSAELKELKNADGHHLDTGTIIENATCKKPGSRTRTCTICGITKIETIPVLDHKIVVKKGYAATVFKTGLTDYKYCSVCNTVLATQKKIAKLKPTIKLSKTSVKIKRKKTITIKVSKLAKGDSVKSWKSSDKKIAIVSKKGKIKGKNKGKCIITVTLKSGKKAKIKVKVK